jgi:hypothetical protein
MPEELFADMERRAHWQRNVFDGTDESLEITEELKFLWTYSTNPAYEGAPRVKLYEVTLTDEERLMMREQLENAKRYTEYLTLNWKS